MDERELEAIATARAWATSGVARSLREGRRLTLREIAAVVGVVPSTILRWERGERRPRGAAAARYGAVLRRLAAGGAP
jgi:transcriptional regulator with XRE-family HTH domain